MKSCRNAHIKLIFGQSVFIEVYAKRIGTATPPDACFNMDLSKPTNKGQNIQLHINGVIWLLLHTKNVCHVESFFKVFACKTEINIGQCTRFWH